MRRWIVRWMGLGVALAFIGCGDASDPDEVVEPLEQSTLTESGPYKVSLRQSELRYDAPGEDEPRVLKLLVWSPADSGAGGRKSSITLAELLPIPHTDSYDDLPLAGNSPHPFAIYSHGSGGEGSLAYPQAEIMASHGWVVASVDHTGNTTLDSSRKEVEISVLRPLDIREILDAAERGFGFEGFDGAVDVARTFLFGHSFGAFTSLVVGGANYDKAAADALACGDEASDACTFMRDADVQAAMDAGFRDERVKAIGLLAPATMGVLDPGGVEVPTMMLTGDRDQTTRHESASVPIWAGLHHPSDLWVRFADAGHFSFITVCDAFGAKTIELFVEGAKEDGCGEDFLSPTDVATINTAYLFAFAQKHILGVDGWDAFLDGSETFDVAADATLTISTHDE